MNNAKSVPKLRFPKYNDAWDLRKLGELTEVIRNGYLYKADGNRNHRYKVTRIETISSGSINIEKLGSCDEINETYKLEDGDILFSHINSLPYIANTAIYTRELGDIYHGMNLLNIRANCDLIYPRFLYYLLKKEDSRNWFRMVSKRAVNQCSIATTDVANFELNLPRLDEQKKIASLFDKIENLIALHTRKCDKLKEYKKGCLQKMFPRGDADVPEVRFPGFTGAWERRKMFEIAEFNPKSELPNEFEYVDLESVVGTEMISHRTEKKNTAPSRAQRLAKTGDVFFQTVRPYQRNNHLFSKSDTNYVFSTGYAQMRPNIDAHFLMSFLQTDDFVNVVLENCTGTSYPAINSNDLSKLEIILPISIYEQKQIGDTISNLDNLIALHQKECEKYKELKKGLLQQMFV